MIQIRALFLVGLVGLAPAVAGCNSIINAWLDPTVVGSFARSATMEIRTSLTLEDTPFGIPGATFPSQKDLKLILREYSISPGDSLAIEIHELRQRLVPYQAQVQVSATGEINIPVLGRISASGQTAEEFEESLRVALRERGILMNPEVTVNELFLQEASYSIFGIGVSASTNAPLRAGTFPIRRPDLRILEAINHVGGLSEFVTDVYVFRYDEPETVFRRLRLEKQKTNAARSAPEESVVPVAEEYPDAGEPPGIETDSPTRELFEAVAGEEARDDEDAAHHEIPQELELEPTQPFLWVNGEFVPNPEYSGPVDEVEAPRPAIPPSDSAIPTFNWMRLAGDTTFRILRIPAELLRTGDPEANIYVRAGDVIRIVSGEIGVYYVMGQVNRVGPFAFNAEEITLKGAIAAAGGLSPLGWPDRCTIYRRLGRREQMIQVNLDRIFAGKDPDFFIRRGDIINVGTHPFAPFLQRIRAASLPNILSTVGYSFTYARNFADVDSFAVRRNPHNEPDRFPNLFP